MSAHTAVKPALKSYRVTLENWEILETWVDATSPDVAEEAALRLFSENGDADFKLRNCGAEVSEIECCGLADACGQEG